jgi:hypothetical protein
VRSFDDSYSDKVRITLYQYDEGGSGFSYLGGENAKAIKMLTGWGK